MNYKTELHDRDDDYFLALDTMNIDGKITGEKKLQLRDKYFVGACPFSRKLVYTFLPKRKYVVHKNHLRSYFDRGIKLVKLHRPFRFTASPYF